METTETNESTQAPEASGKRPGFLTVLCILTFIWSGLVTLILLLALILGGTIASMLPSAMASMLGGSAVFLAISTVLAAASLFGAIQMWKLKKMGFFLYAGANVLVVIVPLFFGMGFGTVGAIINVLFIVLYYLNVKHMS